jgi:hypothetical protein
MLITSVEHFRGVLLGLLERAQKNLCRDDDLFSTACLVGSETFYLLTCDLPPPVVNPVLRNAVKERGHKVEYVAYIGLGHLTHHEGCEHQPKLPKAAGAITMTIFVEGSHPDFGMHAAHVTFTRAAPKEFSFAKPGIATLKGSPMLRDLWPKRKLNS